VHASRRWQGRRKMHGGVGCADEHTRPVTSPAGDPAQVTGRADRVGPALPGCPRATRPRRPVKVPLVAPSRASRFPCAAPGQKSGEQLGAGQTCGMERPHDESSESLDVAALTDRMLREGGPPHKLSADEFLTRIVAIVNATAEPNEDLLSWVGCGELENLIRNAGEELWPRIEKLARKDVRFRRALRSVWAYDSPEFDRRQALLADLGEFRTTWVRFVVEPTDLSESPGLSWRAVELEGSVSRRQLAPLLRSIADWCERDETPSS